MGYIAIAGLLSPAASIPKAQRYRSNRLVALHNVAQLSVGIT
jgi:hypothetical protein